MRGDDSRSTEDAADAALRQRWREVELKRLQIEDARLELEHARLLASSSHSSSHAPSHSAHASPHPPHGAPLHVPLPQTAPRHAPVPQTAPGPRLAPQHGGLAPQHGSHAVLAHGHNAVSVHVGHAGLAHAGLALGGHVIPVHAGLVHAGHTGGHSAGHAGVLNGDHAVQHHHVPRALQGVHGYGGPVVLCGSTLLPPPLMPGPGLIPGPLPMMQLAPYGYGGAAYAAAAAFAKNPSRKQRRGQGSLERRREARALARGERNACPISDRAPRLPRANSHLQKSLEATATVFEPSFLDSRHVFGASRSSSSEMEEQHQMGSPYWSGWTMICDMLNDSEPTNRASAVQTLRLMTQDDSYRSADPDFGAQHGTAFDPEQARPRGDRVFGGGTAAGPYWGSWGPLKTAQERVQDAEALHRREEVCRAMVANGAVGPLLGLLGDERAETQIDAAEVLRNVASHTALLDDAQGGDGSQEDWGLVRPALSRHSSGAPLDEERGQDNAPRGRNSAELFWSREDVVKPLIDLLDSEIGSVRSSALGTVSELAHASSATRDQIFGAPTFLPRLLNLMDRGELALHHEENPKDENETELRHDECDGDFSSEASLFPSSASAQEDHVESLSQGTAQLVGVLKLLLDAPESAPRVREELHQRPRVIESLVDVATRALPPSEEAALARLGCDTGGPALAWRERSAARAANDALLGLGRQGREVAATAMVQSLEPSPEERFEDDRSPSLTRRPASWALSSESTKFSSERSDESIPNPPSDDASAILRRRRNLAALSALRSFVSTPEPVADPPADEVSTSTSLQAVRDAGGVSAVVDLLGDCDEWTCAGASLTIRALVRADDDGHSRGGESQVSIRAELSASKAVPRLVSVLKGAREHPEAAVQAAQAIVVMVRNGVPGEAATERSGQAARSGQATEDVGCDLMTQLKQAIAADESVIGTIVELLQNVLEEPLRADAAQDLAETLRSVALDDIQNQMRIRDAGGVRPLMTVIARLSRGDGAVADDGGQDAAAEAVPEAASTSTAASKSTKAPAEPSPLAESPRGSGKVARGGRPACGYARDDIAVHVGAILDHAGVVGMHARLCNYRGAFRRWFVQHNIIAACLQRALACARDAKRLVALQMIVRGEKATVLRAVADYTSSASGRCSAHSLKALRRPVTDDAPFWRDARNADGPPLLSQRPAMPDSFAFAQMEYRALALESQSLLGDDPLFEHYDHARRELSAVQGLADFVAKEVNWHSSFGFKVHRGASTAVEANLSAELHLLSTTFSALGELQNAD